MNLATNMMVVESLGENLNIGKLPSTNVALNKQMSALPATASDTLLKMSSKDAGKDESDTVSANDSESISG